MITLYHYVHCPFCLRVRMTLGFLNIPWKSVVLSYDDEKTPQRLIGQKMLPILAFEDGHTMGESLDIMKRLDRENKLLFEKYSDDLEFNSLLSKLGESIHPLCMPYWIYSKEFEPRARRYFQKKKEKKYGPLDALALKREAYTQSLKKNLQEVEQMLVPFYKGEVLSVCDILLASHLWGLYAVVEFQFPPTMHEYLQTIKRMCAFDYHRDFWSKAVPES